MAWKCCAWRETVGIPVKYNISISFTQMLVLQNKPGKCKLLLTGSTSCCTFKNGEKALTYSNS